MRLWSENDAVPRTADSLLHGLELQQAHSLSVWDALVVRAALEARCEILLSEDLQAGKVFGELEIVNPFLGTSAHESAAVRYRAGANRARKTKGRRVRPAS